MKSARFSDSKRNVEGDRLRLHELERRDWHLWSLAILIIVALASCILAIAFPQLGHAALPGARLNTYLIALLVLVALFCGYTIQTLTEIKILRRRLSTNETDKGEIRSLLSTVKEQREKLEASEGTLKTANEKLRKLDQLKSDFISTVSHELRTPLTSIENAARLMHSGKTGAIDEDQERFLHVVLRNIDRLTGVVNDFLSLSKLESGKTAFHFSELDLGPVIRDVITAFSPEAESQSLTLSAVVSTPLPRVFGDRERLGQVLRNLVSNALELTPSGGRVTVLAHGAPDCVVVKVVDSGVGVSEEDQGRIFDGFQQTGDPLVGTSRGTGLGLSIAKQTIRAHGGDIWVESELDKGSRFLVELPVCSARSKEMAALEREVPEASRRRMRLGSRRRRRRW